MTDPAAQTSDKAPATTRRRILFRFSLRFLLLVTFAAAGVLAWSIQRAEECRIETEIVGELQAAGLRIKPLPQPATIFETIFGDRFSKQGWEVVLYTDDMVHLAKLSELERVESIYTDGCTHLNLTAFSNLKNLKSFNMTFAFDLETLEGIEHLQKLESLVLGDCFKITTAKPLTTLKNLESITILNQDGNLTQIQDFEEVLNEMTALKSFVAYECPVKSLMAFSNCKNLERLELWLDASGITSLDGLGDLPHFKQLDLTDANAITDLKALESMTELTDLRFFGGCQATSLEFLHKMKKLKSLDLRMNHELLTQDGKSLGEALAPIMSLPQLEKLQISSKEIASLGLQKESSLVKFPQLRELTIYGNSPSIKLSRLSTIPSLRTLHLRNMGRLTSLDGIESLGSLKEVRLHGCGGLSDIKQLGQLVSLDEVHIWHCKKIPPPQIANLKAALPNTAVDAR